MIKNLAGEGIVSHHFIAGIPNVYWYGIEGEYNIMAMELLGPSLEELFNYCKRKCSLKTALMLADQMVTRLRIVNSRYHESNMCIHDSLFIGI